MKIYTLRFSEDAEGVARRIEFKAEDLTTALIIAHREAARRTAELWDEARKLCTIRREAAASDAPAPSHHRQAA
ncbi:MAG: hypothetical protein E2586_01865 [Novosphingobium sp.]|uniref:hypothetical protein n=1 Tax=Novosphingobium sp. TaxID=1874826 RepID=UPI0012CB6A30|nr:hypothetical protein [Novosphingobium sp.]MPS67230.1 hypothetical protein [Novosphingobium sp.]